MRRCAISVWWVVCLSAPVWGQASAIPQLSSRPGAPYTLYLNFGGFSYTGTWNTLTPGITPAYDTDGTPSTFSASELANIRNIWSRVSEKYAAFNVNVTTVDPAVAAGQSNTDLARQTYYDSRPRMMHTVVGGNGTWVGQTGVTGISFSSVAASAQPNSGRHTNWTFSSRYVTGGVPQLQGIGETTTHENGHALQLRHQSLWNGNNLLNEYDPGDAHRAPTMGNADLTARGLWRVGTTNVSSTSIQNDVGVLLTNAAIGGTGVAGFVDSGIGHTLATATPLPLTGNTIDFATAKGLITPNSTTPNPLGEANYTTDFFQFTFDAGGGHVNVTLHSGRSTITPGAADPGATLDATLRLLNASGTPLATSNTGTFSENIALNNLGAGTYYLQISSAGANSQYFDMGSYFLTGTLTPVPEPTTGLLFGAVAWGVWRRIRANRRSGTARRFS